MRNAPTARRPVSRSTLLLVCSLFTACSDKGDDTGGAVGLPEETGNPISLDTAPLVFDTADTAVTDEQPEHTLSLSQVGSWELSPRGGPWTTLTGELVVTEIVDGDEALPACTATFALTGEADGAGCDNCDAAFVVDFYLAEGDTTDCLDPDLPEHDEVRRLAWSSVEEAIYFDYYGSGVWIRWYDAAEIEDEDRIEFEWTAETGVAVEEEEE